MTVFDDLVALANPTVLTRDLHRQAGASWEIRQYLEVDGVPMVWTGCTATCMIKTSSDALMFTWTTLALTTGWLTMSATPTQTTLTPGLYLYDVDVVNASGRRLAFMAGTFRIGRQVTT